MTQPVQEPTQGRVDSGQEFRTRQLFRRPASATPAQVWVNYEIKLFPDSDAALVVDGAFFFPIPEDLNGLHLVAGACGVSTPGGSGTMTVQVQNQGTPASPLTDDMFSTEITIDAGDTTSYTASTPPVVDTGVDQVFTGQTLRVDVDTVPATDGLGLALILSFDSVPGGTGAIGPPGPTGPTGPTGSGNVATDSIWDTKGDIAVATGADAAIVVPVGTNGQVLVADSGETAGVKWDSASSGTTRYLNKPGGNITRAATSVGAFSTAWQITGVVVASGQNVILKVMAAHGGSSFANDRLFAILRGSTQLAAWNISGNNPINNGPVRLEWVDENPGAGTYTYEVQGAMFTSGTLTVYQSNPTTDVTGGSSVFIAEVYTP